MARERFRLPTWFSHEEDVNPHTLEALWSALLRLDPDLAVRMVYLTDAAGKHLDAHGLLYGVARRNREPDDAYRQRIFAEVLNPRSTADAIEDVIEAAIPGSTATVIPPTLGEPSLYFDGGWTFDGTETFRSIYSGTQLAIFDVIVEGENIDNALVRSIIERIRAAGYIPTVASLFALDATRPPGEGASGTSQVIETPYFDGSRSFDGSWTFGTTAVGPPQPL